MGRVSVLYAVVHTMAPEQSLTARRALFSRGPASGTHSPPFPIFVGALEVALERFRRGAGWGKAKIPNNLLKGQTRDASGIASGGVQRRDAGWRHGSRQMAVPR